uniref:DUF4129 domain-containing protein n=1 Tax=Gracilinema caldarium TaxID=215591 RepID=A0A7C3EB92_9SPIR
MAEQERFTNFVHPLFAVSIPACFLYTQVAFLSRWIPSWPLPPLAALALLGFIGLITVLLGNLFRKERLGFSARLRELLVLAVILYLAASLVTLFGPGIKAGTPINLGDSPAGSAGTPRIPQGSGFLAFLHPSLLSVAVTSLGLLQWTFSVILQGALRDRELLLAEIDDSQGLELQYRLRDTGTLAEDTLKGLRKIKAITRILLAFILVEATVHGILNPGQGLGSQIFILPLFLLYPFLVSLISRYMREQYDAGAGIAPDSNSRLHQVRSLSALLLAVFALAFLTAGTSSILPIQWILAFFYWLSSLLPKHAPLPSRLPESLPEAPDMETFKRDLEALAANQNTPVDLTVLWFTLGIFSALVAGLFLLFFLVSPLRSRYFWQRVRQILSLKNFWQGLKKLFSYLKPQKAKQIDGLDLDPDNLKQVRDQLEKMTAEKEDRRKRAQLGKMADRYLRFLRWGEAMKIPCRPSMAPGEYAELLSHHFPEIGEPIHRIARIFEAALYGDTLITRDQWNQFTSAIETVVGYEKT